MQDQEVSELRFRRRRQAEPDSLGISWTRVIEIAIGVFLGSLLATFVFMQYLDHELTEALGELTRQFIGNAVRPY